MKPQTKREYLRDLVAVKNQWSRPLTDEEKALGFLGWHERGYLPHCDFPNLIQFVTLRLADSMPVSRRGEWEHLLKIEDDREKRTKLEEYLDRGRGECHLRDPRIAKLAEDGMLHFHNERYELLAWCVMPNHVHVLVHVWQWPLWKMVQNWKVRIENQRRRTLLLERRAPSRQVSIGDTNEPRRCSALQWQREYWDTFMRGAAQEKTAIRYIENNPVKAKLCSSREQWPFSSARFRDKFQRLVIPTGMPSTVPA
ncbi:MAG TPA: transposase [Verrucomicrobiae bacterium]|nr:transposase [Verrucomicrobiae bacterium]